MLRASYSLRTILLASLVAGLCNAQPPARESTGKNQQPGNTTKQSELIAGEDEKPSGKKNNDNEVSVDGVRADQESMVQETVQQAEFGMGATMSFPPPHSLTDRELNYRKAEIRAALELDEDEYALELMNQLIQDVLPPLPSEEFSGPGAPPFPGQEDGFTRGRGFGAGNTMQPSPAIEDPSRPQPPPGMGNEYSAGREMPGALRGKYREALSIKAEIARFLTRYEVEQKRITLLKNKLKSGQINSDSLSLPNLIARERELESRKAEFTNRFRKQSPNWLKTSVEIEAELLLLPEDQFPNAGIMVEWLNVFQETFSTLPESNDELFELIKTFHDKDPRKDLEHRPGIEGVEPRRSEERLGDLDREIRFLKNRLEYLEREREILAEDKPAQQRQKKADEPNAKGKEQTRKKPEEQGKDESVRPLPRLRNNN